MLLPARSLIALAALLLLAPAAPATLLFDRVLLKDGRTIEGTILPSNDTEFVRLEIRGTTVPIRADLIEKTFVENLENYVPKNKKEEDYLKKGWVIFEGNWMSKDRRAGELKKRADADKAAIEEAKRLQDWRNAVTEETRHFVFKSNCTEEVRREYIERLEAFYKYFTDDWGISLSPGEVRGKMQFFLYRNYTDFLRVTGVPYGVGGFFSFPTKELQLYHDQDDPETTRDTLFHEGNHLLTYLIDTQFRYPIWLNEGMAEYYGTTHIDEKGKFHVGGLQFGRIVSLRTDKAAGEFMTLREVLTTEQPEFRARHYAVAWSFVHFLMQSPEYAKTFRNFFANLGNNRDLDIEIKSYSNVKGSLKEVTLDNLLLAFEKRMGKSLETLEKEWLAYIEQAYGELSPTAWYLAARMALRNPQEDDSHVKTAAECYEKAVTLGIEVDDCYRDYAEMLREGGIKEPGETVELFPPDIERAWDVIQRAIHFDPLQAANYLEAAEILVLDSSVQDLDRAVSLATIALAVAPNAFFVKFQHDGIISRVEAEREKRRTRLEAEAAVVVNDQRNWHVAPYFVQGQTAPENIKDLSTADLRELIRAGKVTARDHIWQSWRDPDPERPGELLPGKEAWELGWVALKDVPIFADDLAAAKKG
ncbi:MAG: DUF1570 domain-containing protein [Planctomycetota bacterium]